MVKTNTVGVRGMTFSNEEQRKLGGLGEDFLVSSKPKWFSRTSSEGRVVNGREGDLFCGKRKVEVKTDSYSINKKDFKKRHLRITTNFMMERFSNNNKKTPGGPWQALGHHCDIFIYFYFKNLTLYVFRNIPTLIKLLENLFKEGRVKEFLIPNNGYETLCYQVRIKLLEALWEEHIIKFTSLPKPSIEILECMDRLAKKFNKKAYNNLRWYDEIPHPAESYI